MNDIFGYVNGEAVYSRDEYIFKKRGFGPIESDVDLMNYARKVTSNWYSSGWNHDFRDFYLGDYCLDHPMCDLTTKEYARLKQLQKDAIAEAKRIDKAREWKLIGRYCYADNSEEEEWMDKDGNVKRVMVIYPHGD